MRSIPTTILLAALSAAPGCAQAPGDLYPYSDTDPGPEGDSGSPDASTDTDTDTDTDADTDADTDTDTETSTGDDTGTETASDTGGDTGTGEDTETATEPDTASESDTGTDTGTWPDACSGPGVWLHESDWYPGGLCWEDPPVEGLVTWAEAVAYCEDLDLGGYDDWAMPTVNHLRSLVEGCPDPDPICGLIDPDWLALEDAETCDACPEFEGPGAGGCYVPPELAESGCDATAGYWSSSDVEDYVTPNAWVFNAMRGYHIAHPKESTARVRCSRPL